MQKTNGPMERKFAELRRLRIEVRDPHALLSCEQHQRGDDLSAWIDFKMVLPTGSCDTLSVRMTWVCDGDADDEGRPIDASGWEVTVELKPKTMRWLAKDPAALADTMEFFAEWQHADSGDILFWVDEFLADFAKPTAD